MYWKVFLAAGVVVAGCSFTAAANVPDEKLPVAYNQTQLEVGGTYRYKFQIHCGMQWLIDFNGVTWTTDDSIFDGAGRYSEDLRKFFSDPNQQISPELWTHITLVAPGEIRLTLPDGSQESIYHPSIAEWPGCA